MTTHDYTIRCWGWDYTFDPVDGGQKAKMMGWSTLPFWLSVQLGKPANHVVTIQPGDFLILKNGEGTTP